jgi:hypothetical protein
MHCDQHVVKMPLETAQLLSTALALSSPQAWQGLQAAGLAYKPTHPMHPCASWARECINNYLWLCALGLELCREYEYRFGNRPGPGSQPPRQHASQPVIAALREHAPPLPRRRAVSPFVAVVPEDCAGADPVAAYRCCYVRHKSAFARWTRREPPDWYVEGLYAQGIRPPGDPA